MHLSRNKLCLKMSWEVARGFFFLLFVCLFVCLFVLFLFWFFCFCLLLFLIYLFGGFFFWGGGGLFCFVLFFAGLHLVFYNPSNLGFRDYYHSERQWQKLRRENANRLSHSTLKDGWWHFRLKFLIIVGNLHASSVRH